MKQQWNVPGTGHKAVTEDGLRWELDLGAGVVLAFAADGGEDAVRHARRVLEAQRCRDSVPA